MVASIRPADAVADNVVALEKDRWLKGLVQKTKHPKVRSGCLTCKQRRLKCDEAKPHCLRCTRSGRECAGYITTAPKTSLLPELGSPPDALSVTSHDDELLTYFLGEATDQLAGFSFALKEFCQSLAPQLGYHYPAVRYALLSVAAKTKAAALRWDVGQPRAAAMGYKSQSLVYYNNAIHNLTSNLVTTKVPAEVYLVCGLLFAATEFWPHRHMAPTVHVLTAFRLILRGRSMLPEAVQEGMFPFLVHMGRKTLAFADDIPQDLAIQVRTFVWQTIKPPEVPNTFKSLNKAWSFMDTLVNYIGSFSDNHLKLTVQESTDALHYATTLQTALLNTTSIIGIDDHHQQNQYRVLLMHHRTLQVMLDVASVGPGDEMTYDLFTADFEYILYECEALLALEQFPSPSQSISKPEPWHSTLGFLAPLFFIASRCRIPSLRHRAIKTLHASRRREREWNSCIATMLARFVVRTETRGGTVSGGMATTSTNGTVAEEHRICLESVDFDREGELMTVTYVHPRTGEKGIGTLQWRIEAAGGIDDDFECVMVPRRRLRMSGYCGVMLVTPPIQCQCGGEQSRVQLGSDG